MKRLFLLTAVALVAIWFCAPKEVPVPAQYPDPPLDPTPQMLPPEDHSQS